MARIRFSAAARADLVAIDDYGAAQFGEDVADAYARGLRETFDLLRRHPRAGAIWPGFGRTMRCQVHRQHRVFYQLIGDEVLIVRILHHAMDVRSALRGRRT